MNEILVHCIQSNEMVRVKPHENPPYFYILGLNAIQQSQQLNKLFNNMSLAHHSARNVLCYQFVLVSCSFLK